MATATTINLETLNSGEPTFETSRGFTHIDWSITSPSLVPTLNWHVHHNNLQSDHFPIIIDFPDLHINPLQNTPKLKKLTGLNSKSPLPCPMPLSQHTTKPARKWKNLYFFQLKRLSHKLQPFRNLNLTNIGSHRTVPLGCPKNTGEK